MPLRALGFCKPLVLILWKFLILQALGRHFVEGSLFFLSMCIVMDALASLRVLYALGPDFLPVFDFVNPLIFLNALASFGISGPWS